MARYRCEQCEKVGETIPCRYCGAVNLRKLDDGTPADPLAEQIAQRTAALTEQRTATNASEAVKSVAAARARSAAAEREWPPPASESPSHQSPSTPPAANPVGTTASGGSTSIAKAVNLDSFEKLLQKGVKAVVICGGSQVGKSQIAHGFTEARKIYRGRTTPLTLGMQAGVRYDVALGGTAPGSVWYQIIDRRRAFLDPSGEFFRQFSGKYRRERELGRITEAHFDFVRSAVRKLAGVVMVFDLTNQEDPDADDPWAEQESVAAFTLHVLRWLRYDRKARYKDLDVLDAMNLFLEKKKKKLDVPVLVLFSKADRLAEFTNEHPLAFASRRLTTLHAALLTNARKFRFDWAQTMKQITKDVARPVKYPCGVLLSMEWLLDGPFRRLRPLDTSLLGGGK